jgi:hypothetical protein
VHTEKNVFGAITYFGRRHVIHKGRAFRVNHYNLSGEFALHNPAERALVHGSQPVISVGQNKKCFDQEVYNRFVLRLLVE